MPLNSHNEKMINKEKEFKTYTRKDLLKMRDAAIKKDFDHLTGKKHLDSNYVIHEILQTKYYLDTRIIFLIVRETYRKSYHK